MYRSRFLQPNTHFVGIFRDLQDLHSFAPLPIQYVSNISSESSCNFQNFVQNLLFFTTFIEFCTDFYENFSEFRQITQRPLRILQRLSSWFLVNSEHNFDDSDRISTEFRWQWFEWYGPGPTESYIPGIRSRQAAEAPVSTAKKGRATDLLDLMLDASRGELSWKIRYRILLWLFSKFHRFAPTCKGYISAVSKTIFVIKY